MTVMGRVNERGAIPRKKMGKGLGYPPFIAVNCATLGNAVRKQPILNYLLLSGSSGKISKPKRRKTLSNAINSFIQVFTKIKMDG